MPGLVRMVYVSRACVMILRTVEKGKLGIFICRCGMVMVKSRKEVETAG